MRPRSQAYRRLPMYLYCRRGYYSYVDPETRTEHGLGRDKDLAVAFALQANANLDRPTLVERLVQFESDLRSPELLQARVIAARAVPMTMECGVYFLLRRREIVYVGKSMNCARRIRDHWAQQIKNFDAFYVLPCTAELVDHMEMLYINKFRPILNSGPGKRGQSRSDIGKKSFDEAENVA